MFDPEFEWCLFTDGAWRESAYRRIASFRKPESAENRPGALPGASRGTPAEETFPGSGYADPPQEWGSAKSIPCECTCPAYGIIHSSIGQPVGLFSKTAKRTCEIPEKRAAAL